MKFWRKQKEFFQIKKIDSAKQELMVAYRKQRNESIAYLAVKDK